MNLSDRKAFIILAILLLFILVVNIITFKQDHNWNNVDFAGYILCAKSIVDGTVNELDLFDKFLSDNSTKDTGVIISKWGFPLLLSPVYYFWGLDIYAMKIFVSLFFPLSLWMVFL
ncbi:MAG: hypothetical protein KAJ10_15475, partial [Thermodesulfovibrionia bacterium]|nr:hypothetical protein [Thermodesulfovibrionia bacterium]